VSRHEAPVTMEIIDIVSLSFFSSVFDAVLLFVEHLPEVLLIVAFGRIGH